MTPTPKHPFTDTADPNDVLQVAADIGLGAIKTKLGLAGIEPDDYSVVITLETRQRIGTVLHVPNEPENVEMAALEVQLRHLQATALAHGLEVHVTPRMPGTYL